MLDSIVLVAFAVLAQDVRFEEALLATVPDGYTLEGTPMRGPDGVVYPNVLPVVWSPDGRRVAYAAFHDGVRHPIVDDEIHDSFDFVDPPTWSPNSEHVVFRIGDTKSSTKEAWWALLDGKKEARCDWHGSISVTNDGDLVRWEMPKARIEANGAYTREPMYFRTPFKKGKKWTDGTAISRSPLVAADGSWCASAAANDDGRWTVIVATKKGEKDHGFEESWIADIAVSLDGRQVAVAVPDERSRAAPAGGPPGMPPGFAMPGMGATVVRHGKKTFGRDYDSAAVPIFTPNGKHLAFKALRGEQMGLAFDNDDEAATPWDFVWSPVFSADSRRYAHVANKGGVMEPFWRTTSIGDYAECAGGTNVVVLAKVDGDEIDRWGPFEGTVVDVVIPPGDGPPAFAVEEEGGWRIHWGDRASELFDELGSPVFDQEGERVAFGARIGRELWWKVLGPEEVEDETDE